MDTLHPKPPMRDLTRIILEDGSHITVRESQAEVMRKINEAHALNHVAVAFTRFGGTDQGVMVSRIVRWD